MESRLNKSASFDALMERNHLQIDAIEREINEKGARWAAHHIFALRRAVARVLDEEPVSSQPAETSNDKLPHVACGGSYL